MQVSRTVDGAFCVWPEGEAKAPHAGLVGRWSDSWPSPIIRPKALGAGSGIKDKLAFYRDTALSDPVLGPFAHEQHGALRRQRSQHEADAVSSCASADVGATAEVLHAVRRAGLPHPAELGGVEPACDTRWRRRCPTQVLIAGGTPDGSSILSSAELFNLRSDAEHQQPDYATRAAHAHSVGVRECSFVTPRNFS